MAIVDHDSAMKYIEVFSRGGEEDQIAGLQLVCRLQQSFFRNTVKGNSTGCKARNHIECAGLSISCFKSRDALNRTVAEVMTDPLRHVVVPTVPFDLSRGIAKLPQFLWEMVYSVGRTECKDRLNIGNAVETIRSGAEDLWRLSGTNQDRRLIWPADKRCGEQIHPRGRLSRAARGFQQVLYAFSIEILRPPTVHQRSL